MLVIAGSNLSLQVTLHVSEGQDCEIALAWPDSADPSPTRAVAFAGLTFLSLYMSGKMHLLDRRGFAIKSWLVAAPLLGAALIAVSRTMDYRHHATDVIAGGLLGFTVSLIVYHLCEQQKYPAIK